MECRYSSSGFPIFTVIDEGMPFVYLNQLRQAREHAFRVAKKELANRRLPAELNRLVVSD